MAITKEIISNALLANEKYSSYTLSKLMRNTKDTLLKMFEEIDGDLNSLESIKEKKTKMAKVDLAISSDIPNLGMTYSMVHYEMFKIHNDKNIFEDVIDNQMIDEILSKDIKYRDNKDILHTLIFGSSEHKKAADEFKEDVLNPLNRGKKRLKILKFLSEQNSVYINIINIIKKKESKFSYIKDVIKELREYVKVGKTETKLFGEVMTPLEVVKDMMATLPEEVWSNPNLKWLDPANGCGPFPAYVIYRLMVGLSEWQPDEELRYKHIIENMIYVSELQPKNMFLWLFTIDPKDEYKPNIYCGSFLEKGFDFHMKNVWEVDKFDLILGNPPYNNEVSGQFQSSDLYDQFIIKSMLLTDEILMIIPSRWMNKNDKKSFRNTIINYGVSKIITNNDISFFKNTHISGGVCYLQLINGFNNLTLFNNNLVNLKEQLEKTNFISEKNNNVLYNVLEKLKVNNKISNFNSQGYFGLKTNHSNLDNKGIKTYFSDRNGSRLKINKDENSYYSYVDISYISDKKNLINTYKVITPSAYGYKTKTNSYYHKLGKIFCINPNEICTESYVFFDFKTEKESLNFKKYLETRFVSFLISLKKIKQHVTSKIFELVPEMDFNIEWNDEKIFEYFDLSEEEKNLILE